MRQCTDANNFSVEALQAWLDAYRRYPPPPAAVDPYFASADSYIGSLAFDQVAWLTLFGMADFDQVCIDARDRHADSRMQACDAIAHLLIDKGRTFEVRDRGFTPLANRGEVSDQDRATFRNLQWLLVHSPGYGENHTSAADWAAFRADWLESRDEIEAVRRLMRRADLPLTPPASWKAPYDYLPKRSK